LREDVEVSRGNNATKGHIHIDTAIYCCREKRNTVKTECFTLAHGEGIILGE
jgi:hypothetical protein